MITAIMFFFKKREQYNVIDDIKAPSGYRSTRYILTGISCFPYIQIRTSKLGWRYDYIGCFMSSIGGKILDIRPISLEAPFCNGEKKTCPWCESMLFNRHSEHSCARESFACILRI